MDDRKRLDELKRIRKYLTYLFIVFVLIPIFLGPYIITSFESTVNENLKDYWDAFFYNYQVITGTELTDTKVISDGGKLVVGILSLLYLVFFSFIAGIIMTTIEIKSITKGLDVM